MTIGKVKRETTATVRDLGKDRPVTITIHPNGTIGLRLKGTRREYYADAATLYRRLEVEDTNADAGPCKNPKRRLGMN